MSDLLPTAAGPFTLDTAEPVVRPGQRVRVASREATVVGVIVCVDEVEAWIEALLDLPGPAPTWLAIETREHGYRCTVWQRTTRPTAPPMNVGLEGRAAFRSVGAFPGFPIPERGTMIYREDPGPPATAAERFSDGGPWLIGQGDGADIRLEAISA
jgi:hypothetical protein